MRHQRSETLVEADLTFVRWINHPESVVFADDDGGYHVYTRNDLAKRVIIYCGERYAFMRLATEEEQAEWSVVSPSDEEGVDIDLDDFGNEPEDYLGGIIGI